MRRTDAILGFLAVSALVALAFLVGTCRFLPFSA